MLPPGVPSTTITASMMSSPTPPPSGAAGLSVTGPTVTVEVASTLSIREPEPGSVALPPGGAATSAVSGGDSSRCAKAPLGDVLMSVTRVNGILFLLPPSGVSTPIRPED